MGAATVVSSSIVPTPTTTAPASPLVTISTVPARPATWESLSGNEPHVGIPSHGSQAIPTSRCVPGAHFPAPARRGRNNTAVGEPGTFEEPPHLGVCPFPAGEHVQHGQTDHLRHVRLVTRRRDEIEGEDPTPRNGGTPDGGDQTVGVGVVPIVEHHC